MEPPDHTPATTTSGTPAERRTAISRNLFDELLGCLCRCPQARTPYDPA
ncbi:hypothetical protein ACICHK_01685 [Streptomyces sp. AHU1]